MAARSPVAHRAFVAAIAIKGFDGAVETLAGLIVAIVGSKTLYDLAVAWTAPELENNPASHVANWIRHGATALNHASTSFVVIYLLAHGIIKLGIAINLLRERTWIFPVAVVVLSGFVAFMGYRLSIHWSWWLLVLALFDAVTIGLVVNEWRANTVPVASPAH